MRADRRLREASGRPCRPRRRPAAGRRDRRGSRRAGREADLLRAGAGARQEADPLGRRRAGHRGHGSRRPYRPGLDLGAGAGNPARRRRARFRCSSPAASAAARLIAGYLEMGAVGRPARHPLRLRHRMHRPSQLQEGVHPRLGPRRDRLACRSIRGCRSFRCARSRTASMETVHRQAARSRPPARRGRGRNGRGPAPDRALLGGRAAPRGDRRRCRARLA